MGYLVLYFIYVYKRRRKDNLFIPDRWFSIEVMTGMISAKIQKAAESHFYQKLGRGVFGTSELQHFYCDMILFYYFNLS